ncbi:tyrosine-protein phosphatase non-receptor type 14 [Agrilus planipennis]|uniref:protein-tyrosine-phosphatase n=1 Tax=Agrilus planipennis TaxID=224129 RepID=A0A7F5REE0_AGRPL|nr:tyrosine-protein phosphatase non-receptor type 14 [Agrilus planipennis]
MPFKLKLKKSRHYSVVSKTLFVISVEMLDSTNIECTLSSESTGQDCLDIVCQKLGLNQPKFFGLQYMSRSKDRYLCWLELDKPIKRQLDKHSRNLCLYLRVMYYILSGCKLLNDEVTRYHYFLQLKMDVIDGRISCTPQQAVELASYCMQAEFGNYDVERHTAHYLKDFQLFPKSFTDPTLLETLTDAAIRQHAALHSLPQGTAEEYYICACQKLDGYGQELFSVKDHSNEDAVLGVSLTGVTVFYPNGKEGRSYGWIDISNVINHKRDFAIESVIGSERTEFHFSDVECAKNAWRFCVLQHMFYRQYEMSNSPEHTEKGPPIFQQTHVEGSLCKLESYEDVTNSQPWNRSSSLQALNQRAQSTSCLDLNTPTDIDKLRSLLPSYRPAPDYDIAVQQKYRNSSSAIPPAREPLRNARAMLYSSQPEIHQPDTYSSHLRYPDVTHNNIEQKNIMSGLYKTSYSQSQVLNTDNQQLIDLAERMRLLNLYKPPPPYPSNRISSNSTPDLPGISQQYAKPHSNFIHSLVSGSSPDLVSNTGILNHQHYLRQYGTTVYTNQHPIHRSHSYLPAPQHGTYENLASIFDSNIMGRPQALIVDNPNITKHIKKVYDEHGNIIYCMPANMKQILQENQLPSSGFVVTRTNQSRLHEPNNTNEPIYENIPLPWQNENSQMRSRAQSIQSAPEISQVINHALVNALQNKVKLSSQNIENNNHQEKRENLYANIQNNPTTVSTSKTNLSLNNLKDASSSTNSANRSTQNLNGLNSTHAYQKQINKSTTSDLSCVLSQKSNSFLANKSSSIHSSSTNNSVADGSNVSGETFSDLNSSNGSAGKSKKKRWGILIGGRSKSSEKIKSATLGREKAKNKDKNQSNNRHRWSTGLPRMHPLPPSISKETMCQLLENKLADSQLFFEFDKIPKKKQNADFSTALHPDNAKFNRFKDVLPYEENRLRLTPTKENRSGYINASHITATVGSKQRFYIAAQCPTKLTIPHFWQCVWEAEVYLMVQLTDPTEDINYLPNSNERCINASSDYQIWWEFSQKTGHCITSKVRLCQVTSRRYRTLWHLHYTDWGEHGCPHSVAHFLGFLEELQSVQQHSLDEIPLGHNKNPPVFVHCTAGVGRTGLTILADLLLYTLDHNQEVDVPRVVGLLRHQRPYMVQTIAQYRFVYSLLKTKVTEEKPSDIWIFDQKLDSSPDGIMTEIMWKYDGEGCARCNKNQWDNGDWVLPEPDKSIWQVDKDSLRNIWNGGEICTDCCSSNGRGKFPLQSQLREDISQDENLYGTPAGSRGKL